MWLLMLVHAAASHTHTTYTSILVRTLLVLRVRVSPFDSVSHKIQIQSLDLSNVSQTQVFATLPVLVSK